MSGQEPQKRNEPQDRRIGGVQQDEFTQEEFVERLQHFSLERGRYEMDVNNGKIKLSKISKRWIQEQDFVTA